MHNGIIMVEKIILARSGGFCFGVKRAVSMAEQAISEGRLYMLGEIIHNSAVINRLEAMGGITVDDPADIKGGSVLIRSHGVTPDVLDGLAARGLRVIDATCPYVKKIHGLVSEARGTGCPIYVVGKKDHPEVIGIAGWGGGNVRVLESTADAAALPYAEKAFVVSQTTADEELFHTICSVIREKTGEAVIYNTICRTTSLRQKEARIISSKVDLMIVIGSKKSSNTAKLYDICSANCKNVHWIEVPQELLYIDFMGAKTVGVTAGASTPEWLIKEVMAYMSAQDTNEMSVEMNQDINLEPAQETETAGEAAAAVEEKAAEITEVAAEQTAEGSPAEEANDNASSDSNFMEAIDNMVKIRNGQLIKGTVVRVDENEVCVNIGYKADGFIPRRELSAEDVNPVDVVKVGDEIEVEVLRVNDGEGNVLLSKKNVDTKRAWADMLDRMEKGETFEGTVKEVVKGGVISYVEGIRAFIPASHLALRYVDKLDQFVGKTLTLKVLEVDRARRHIAASHKNAIIEENERKRKAAWENLEVGKVIEGTVKRLTQFGAFVDVGGVDGLVHITDIAWGRIRQPGDVLKVNEKIKVVVLALDEEKNRISLGYKQLQPKPWELAETKYPVGSVVEGKVVRIVPFGAFVELEPSLDGLVHISQISTSRIPSVESVLNVGDVVKVKVLEVDPKAKRISLSIRATLEEEKAPEAPAAREEVDDLSDDLSGSLSSSTTTIGDLIDISIFDNDGEEK